MESCNAGSKSEKSKVKDEYMRFQYKIDEKGVALVFALLMMVISFAIILAVLSFITKGTNVSSLTRQYHSAHDAAYGGADFVTKEILPKVISGVAFNTLGNYNGMLNNVVTNPCFTSKLTLPTNQWGCSDSGLNLDPTTGGANYADFQIQLQGTASSSNFNVMVKIVDTVPGNSSTSGKILDSGSAVANASSGVVTPMHIPYTYRVEIQAQRANNPLERASLSGVYLY